MTRSAKRNARLAGRALLVDFNTSLDAGVTFDVGNGSVPDQKMTKNLHLAPSLRARLAGEQP